MHMQLLYCNVSLTCRSRREATRKAAGSARAAAAAANPTQNRILMTRTTCGAPGVLCCPVVYCPELVLYCPELVLYCPELVLYCPELALCAGLPALRGSASGCPGKTAMLAAAWPPERVEALRRRKKGLARAAGTPAKCRNRGRNLH